MTECDKFDSTERNNFESIESMGWNGKVEAFNSRLGGPKADFAWKDRGWQRREGIFDESSGSIKKKLMTLQRPGRWQAVRARSCSEGR
jgi:hypothetical protein